MLRFILGAKGAGKSACCRRLLCEALQKNADLEAVMLVPRQFTFDCESAILTQLGPKDACRVQVLSFSRLADQVFKACGKPQKPILKEGANAAMMLLALDSVRDRLQFFARQSGALGFVKKLVAQIADFKENRVLPEDLRRAAAALPQGYFKTKTEETALIYETYNALVAQSFFDDEDILTAVAEKLPQSGLFNGKLVVIDGFSVFSEQEIAILRHALCAAQETFVALCTTDLEDRSPVSPFALVNKTARQLLALAKRQGVAAAKPVLLTDTAQGFSFYAAPELRHLAASLYVPAAEPFEGQARAVRFCYAPSLREECDHAALQIHALLRAGACRCRDIAVVYRDADSYGAEIKHSFQKFGVPVFEDRRAPVEMQPLMVLVRSLLALCANGFRLETLMRYLKTGLTCFSLEEIAQAENYALMWDLGAGGWQRPWTDNPDGFGEKMNDARKERLCRLNEIREAIVAPLEAFRESMKGADCRTAMRLIYRFLRENGIDEALKAYAVSLEEAGELELALEQGQVWDCLMTVLDELAQTIGERYVSPQTLTDLFDLAVRAQSLGKLPDGFDEVTLCDAARITTQTAQYVFVLGMNAGVFPRGPADGTLFSGHEIALLRTVLPDLCDEQARQVTQERFLVYNALCSARRQLTVSWTLGAPSGEKLDASEAVLQLRQLFPKRTETNYAALSTEAKCEALQPAFEQAARLFGETSCKAQTLKAYFASLPEYAGRFAVLQRAVRRESFAFNDPRAAEALFGKQIRLSASQLETYEQCPFQYFCRYGLQAEPRKTARLDPANSGTVIHYVLEHLLRQNHNASLQSLGEEAAKEQIRRILKTYMDTYMGGAAGKSRRFLYLYERLENTLLTIVERLIGEFSTCSFEPIGFEVKIGEDEAVKPYSVPLKDGSILLRGVIDRVDKMDAEGKRYIRVVDYKTGVKEFALSDVLGGLSMQMLLYLVAIWRDKDGLGRDMVPAGVLYLPARAQAFDSTRGDDAETIRLRRMEGGKMQGMILDDGVVLKGMDSSLSGTFLPFGIKKRGGALDGKFISLAQLGRLAKRMDRIMAQMGDCLHAGKVPAKPVVGKTHGKTCEWCDFSSVCRREPNGEFRYLPYRTHEECLNELDGKGEP